MYRTTIWYQLLRSMRKSSYNDIAYERLFVHLLF